MMVWNLCAKLTICGLSRGCIFLSIEVATLQHPDSGVDRRVIGNGGKGESLHLLLL